MKQCAYDSACCAAMLLTHHRLTQETAAPPVRPPRRSGQDFSQQNSTRFLRRSHFTRMRCSRNLHGFDLSLEVVEQRVGPRQTRM